MIEKAENFEFKNAQTRIIFNMIESNGYIQDVIADVIDLDATDDVISDAVNLVIREELYSNVDTDHMGQIVEMVLEEVDWQGIITKLFSYKDWERSELLFVDIEDVLAIHGSGQEGDMIEFRYRDAKSEGEIIRKVENGYEVLK